MLCTSEWLKETAKLSKGKTKNKQASYAPALKASELCGGRKNPAAHEVFVTHFVMPVVGATKWKKEITRRDSKEKELGTVSDKAFARLLIISNYDCWLDIFEKSDGKVLSRGSNVKVKSSVQPLFSYLAEKDKKIEGGRNQMIAKCINKFNEEYQKVLADRKKYAEVDQTLIGKFNTLLNDKVKASPHKVSAIPKCMGMFHNETGLPPSEVAACKRKRKSDAPIADSDDDSDDVSNESDNKTEDEELV